MNKIFKYKDWDCNLVIAKYYDGNPALLLEDAYDGQQIATLTKNFPSHISGDSDLVALDINNCGNELPKLLIDNDVIEESRAMVIPSGYCNYPVYKLKSDK